MKKYWDDNGLLNSREHEKFAENSPTWTVQWLFLATHYNSNAMDRLVDFDELIATDNVIDSLNKFYDRCHIKGGLYNQRPQNDGSHEDYMSHDQLTAMLCFFKFTRQEDKIMEVLDEIDRQGGHYDNINPSRPKRLLRFWDVWFYQSLIGECGSFKWTILCLIMEYSCNRVWKVRPTVWARVKHFFKHFEMLETRKMVHTDGKLISFIKLKCMSSDSFNREWDTISMIIENHKIFKCWEDVFIIYFGGNHPNTILAKGLR